ncbi:MAG: endo-1,4-beta-xylanase [Sedimentisphaerales bacterium]|nr:endo-1,4-beta-xylanase [Sedimentisphaerales bacterium]
MIRFRAYKDQHPLQRFALNAAHLFAQDEIPVRSQLDFTDDEIIGVRHSDTAVGLATLWSVPDFGRVMLQTTRLPERNEPYNLNLELARGRLLRILQKREEWGVADSHLADAGRDLVDGALEKFIETLCNLESPARAAELADQSLSLSLRAGETMALAHAEMFIQHRAGTQGFGRHSFGCRFDTTRIKDQNYLKFIKDNFHFVTIPIGWKQIEPKEQEQNFALLDECVTWLHKNCIATKVGPLVSFAQDSVPDWLYIWENDFEQVRDMAYDFITKVVERYGNKVQAWDVISAMNAENGFKFGFDQIIEMTRSTALAAKRAANRALVLVEMTEPWGEYYAINQRTIPPLIYADMVCQSGVSFDGFGLKLRFGRAGYGMQARDLLELSTLLDRFGAFGKPLHLASVQVPSAPDTRDPNGNGSDVGCWRNAWTEQTQSDWLENVYRIALSKPYVETITWQDLVDKGNDDQSVLQHGGLLKADLTPKPAFECLVNLKTHLVRPANRATRRN